MVKSLIILITFFLYESFALGAPNFCHSSGENQNESECRRHFAVENAEVLLTKLECVGKREECVERIKVSRSELSENEVQELIYGCNNKGRCVDHTRWEATIEGCGDAFYEIKDEVTSFLRAATSQETWGNIIEKGRERRAEGIRRIQEIGNEYCVTDLNPRDPLEDLEMYRQQYRAGEISRREYDNLVRPLTYRQQEWDKCYLENATRLSDESHNSTDVGNNLKNLIAGMVDGWSCYNRLEQARIMCKSAQVITFGIGTGATTLLLRSLGKKLLGKLVDAHRSVVMMRNSKVPYRNIRFTPHSLKKLEDHFYSNRGLRNVAAQVDSIEMRSGVYSDADIMRTINSVKETGLARRKNTTTVTSRESFDAFERDFKTESWEVVEDDVIPPPANTQLDYEVMRTTFRNKANGPGREEWTVTYCRSDVCEVEGQRFASGDVISSYPKCGPSVFSVPRANSVRFCSERPKNREIRRWREECTRHISKLNKTCS